MEVTEETEATEGDWIGGEKLFGVNLGLRFENRRMGKASHGGHGGHGGGLGLVAKSSSV
jgi:hypothetical protein